MNICMHKWTEMCMHGLQIPPNKMFEYKTRTCDVTEYAANYVTSAGHSPFARAGGNSGK